MGRKNRNKKTTQGNGASGSTEEKCSQQPSAGGKEFDDYMEIRDTVEKIRAIQKDVSLKPEKKDERFTKFIEWLQSKKVDTSCVEIGKFEGLGFGLKATKDLKEGEKFLTLPRDLMMTPKSAQDSCLGPFIEEDKILQVMPSVVLALHLLCERRTDGSPWKPYLDILPDTYSTPLYFTPEEIKTLKASPAQSDCMSQYRNIARQYAYFYKLFQSESVQQSLPLKNVFTYDDYRWAVSTVMTRQNQIPTSDGSKMTFALIPLWDMCNHCNGLITTDFNLEQNCSECYSLRKYMKGDQNEHDRMAVKLGISKTDPLFEKKSELLTRCGLLASRTFYLHTGELPVDSDLLVFLRIFQMDDETLEKYAGSNAAELRDVLGDLDMVVSKETETKVWSYLETRTTLLLRGYDTSTEEDEELLKKTKLSPVERLCVQLRCCEKKILQSASEFASHRKQKLQADSTT
ncbi:SETD3-like protein [Mya arenaria]|uniref:protein-histidine N-methyltransferase n=1 Tax=Mya arenaria TaxID=6604 RepID=A0ABY7FDQ5_MYAAR|nr:SETD3-like protein [Mya arenaria]